MACLGNGTAKTQMFGRESCIPSITYSHRSLGVRQQKSTCQVSAEWDKKSGSGLQQQWIQILIKLRVYIKHTTDFKNHKKKNLRRAQNSPWNTSTFMCRTSKLGAPFKYLASCVMTFLLNFVRLGKHTATPLPITSPQKRKKKKGNLFLNWQRCHSAL